MHGIEEKKGRKTKESSGVGSVSDHGILVSSLHSLTSFFPSTFDYPTLFDTSPVNLAFFIVHACLTRFLLIDRPYFFGLE
jgi:hypothetical protein